jgi:peptidoglycan/xylan/chitin deacetylase (PgdA/CDA1 family)
VSASVVAVAGALGYSTLFGPRSQLCGPFAFRAPTSDKVVALTFDDGPNPPYTDRIVDLLGEKRLQATFFQVGACVERHPGLTAEMAAAGHVIGNHGYSHRFTHYFVEPSLRFEIARTQAVIAAATGTTPTLFRPPWLFHPPGLLSAASQRGLTVVSGTFVHPLEVLQLSARSIARGAVKRARPGGILIFHDGFDARGGFRGATVAAVRLVIDELTDRGFSFTTVDRLLSMEPHRDSSAVQRPSS